MAFVPAFAPESEAQLLVATSLLEAHGIPVFVHNRHFGSLMPGLQMNSLLRQSVMVPEERLADAMELLAPLKTDNSQVSGTTQDD